MIKALIIGAGIVGERHLKAQKKLGSEVRCFDVSKEKEKAINDRFSLIPLSSIEEGLVWADVAHICTPDDLHTDIAILAITQGKSVLCEKPLTTSLRDATKLEELVNKYQTKFLVANNYRLSPGFLSIKKYVEKGKIGRLISLRTTYLHDMRTYHKKTLWRKKQNFLYGGGIHAIDLALWIAQEPVAAVLANTGRKVMKGYTYPEDYQIIIHFKSGLQAEVWANARVVIPTNKTDLEVYGERGVYIGTSKSNTVSSYIETKKQKDFIKDLAKVGYRYTIPKEIEIANKFFLGRTKFHSPLPDIHEAVQVIRVLDAIEMSIEKREVITLE